MREGETKPGIAFRNVRKTFGATIAVDDMTFSVAPGEVCALLGANGAGKSTLIKLLAGLHRADSGEVLVDGLPASGSASIEFIHQDLGLIGTLSVAENVALTRGFARRVGLISWRQVRREAENTLAALGISIDVDENVAELSRAEQSLVAIARAVSAKCRALVLDEPTASLETADVARLFGAVERLRTNGVAILYVTHRLDEVFKIADRVVVMRDGRLVADDPISGVTSTGLVKAIVGRAPRTHEQTRPNPASSPILRIADIRLPGGATPVSVSVKSGEILGIAGLRGAGQEELGRGLAGIHPLSAEFGELNGLRLRASSLAEALERISGFVSSHREREGLAMTLTVRENLFMNPGAAGTHFFSWLSPRHERASAKALAERVSVSPNLPDAIVGTFSGGNQQKVVLARWLFLHLELLILEEPTMGIDVGARAEIYGLLDHAAQAGLAVVVVSSDFEELQRLCHRVLVLDRGDLAGELVGAQITVARLTELATSGTDLQPAMVR